MTTSSFYLQAGYEALHQARCWPLPMAHSSTEVSSLHSASSE